MSERHKCEAKCLANDGTGGMGRDRIKRRRGEWSEGEGTKRRRTIRDRKRGREEKADVKHHSRNRHLLEPGQELVWRDDG